MMSEGDAVMNEPRPPGDGAAAVPQGVAMEVSEGVREGVIQHVPQPVDGREMMRLPEGGAGIAGAGGGGGGGGGAGVGGGGVDNRPQRAPKPRVLYHPELPKSDEKRRSSGGGGGGSAGMMGPDSVTYDGNDSQCGVPLEWLPALKHFFLMRLLQVCGLGTLRRFFPLFTSLPLFPRR